MSKIVYIRFLSPVGKVRHGEIAAFDVSDSAGYPDAISYLKFTGQIAGHCEQLTDSESALYEWSAFLRYCLKLSATDVRKLVTVNNNPNLTDRN